ncbi:hypothetical protein BU16DRAFT_558928 [Lophium mytilinum]|uniref:Uncharacterized protein n=1 Tax=Lophium mytilinum TaxID=390894 RepID=A0A6A6R2W4_9PEZI|nr:hypothetical protein BU16DRAFT_558928 [Lophium mytilinum]
MEGQSQSSTNPAITVDPPANEPTNNAPPAEMTVTTEKGAEANVTVADSEADVAVGNESNQDSTPAEPEGAGGATETNEEPAEEGQKDEKPDITATADGDATANNGQQKEVPPSAAASSKSAAASAAASRAASVKEERESAASSAASEAESAAETAREGQEGAAEESVEQEPLVKRPATVNTTSTTTKIRKKDKTRAYTPNWVYDALLGREIAAEIKPKINEKAGRAPANPPVLT